MKPCRTEHKYGYFGKVFREDLDCLNPEERGRKLLRKTGNYLPT